MHAELMAPLPRTTATPPLMRTHQAGGALLSLQAASAQALHGSASLLRPSHAAGALLALGGASEALLPFIARLADEAIEAHTADPHGARASAEAAAEVEAACVTARLAPPVDILVAASDAPVLTERMAPAADPVPGMPAPPPPPPASEEELAEAAAEVSAAGAFSAPRLRLLRHTLAAALTALCATVHTALLAHSQPRATRAAAIAAFTAGIAPLGAQLAAAPTLLSAEAAHQVLRLALQCSHTPLAADVWRALLLDWAVWVYTPPSLQALVLERLATCVAAWAPHVSARTLVDTGRLYLWSLPTPLSAATEGYGEDVCGFVLADRASANALPELQRALAHLIASAALDPAASLAPAASKASATSESAADARVAATVAAVLSFAVECDDDALVCYVLAALVHQLPRAPPAARLRLWRQHCAGSVALALLARQRLRLSGLAAALLACLLPASAASPPARHTCVASQCEPSTAGVAASSAPPLRDAPCLSGADMPSSTAANGESPVAAGPSTKASHAIGAAGGGASNAVSRLRRLSESTAWRAPPPPDCRAAPPERRPSIASAIAAVPSSMAILGPRPPPPPDQPPRQVALCHALRSLLQLDWEATLCEKLQAPASALVDAAFAAQSMEYAGATGLEPLAVHSAEVYWPLLLLQCCVSTAPRSLLASEPPPSHAAEPATTPSGAGGLVAHVVEAVELLGPAGAALLSYCQGPVESWPGGDQWTAWLMGCITCTWEQEDSIDAPVDPPLAQRAALSPQSLWALGNALALACGHALRWPDGDKRWDAGLRLAKAVDAALPPAPRELPRGTLTLSFLSGLLACASTLICEKVDESRGGGTPGAEPGSAWRNACDLLMAVQVWAESGGVALAALQGGEDLGAVHTRLVDALRPLASMWERTPLSPSLHCSPAFEAPLALLLKAIEESAERGALCAAAAHSMRAMLGGIGGWLSQESAALKREAGVDVVETRTAQSVLMGVLRRLLRPVSRLKPEATGCAESAEEDGTLSCLLHGVVHMLDGCASMAAEGVAASTARLFDVPPTPVVSVPSDDAQVAPAARAAWLALSPPALHEAVAQASGAWLASLRDLVSTSDAASAAIAEEMDSQHVARHARLLGELEAVRAQERQDWVSIQAQVEVWARPVLSSERIRWSDAVAAAEERKRVSERRLRKVLRRLKATRGVWGTAVDADEHAYWKLDKTEDGARRRRRLRRNLAFDSHDEATTDARSDGDYASVFALTSPGCGAHADQRGTDGDVSAEGGVPADAAAAAPSACGAPRKRASLAMRLGLASGPPVASAAEAALLQMAAVRLSATEAEGGGSGHGHSGDGGSSNQVGSGGHHTVAPLFAVKATIVKQLRVIPGLLALTKHALHFLPTSEQLLNGARDRKWELGRLTEVLARRYLLQLCALELFFGGGGGGFSSVFVSFESSMERHALQKALLSQPLPGLLPGHPRKAEEAGAMLRPDPAAWTRLWQLGALSNFEYLMRLNSLAGRGYSDLTQYPVLPWVLSNYTAEHLDLSDAGNYRDLASPIGALNAANHARLDSNYESLAQMHQEIDDAGVAPPPFHYGSHYSSLGVVLYFLLRLEPFTTQALALQDGKFDYADRRTARRGSNALSWPWCATLLALTRLPLEPPCAYRVRTVFHSWSETWSHLVEEGNTSDVKELIPEAYYLPEAFSNHNGFQLGTRQTGEALGDVILPPWARGSAHTFVRVQRAALESEHVSARLHHWIDLVFGAKQKGAAAVAARNCFFHLTYALLTATPTDHCPVPVPHRSEP